MTNNTKRFPDNKLMGINELLVSNCEPAATKNMYFARATLIS